jgi:hypothetical protein
MDILNVYIVQVWHNAPYMLDRSHIVATDVTPVLYDSGQGELHVAGYLASITPEYAAIVLDHAFNIMNGQPPMPEEHLLCDKIKETITNVISKTIASLELELKVNKMTRELKIYLENDMEDPSTPPQISEIQKWETKKLIADHKAEWNPEPYKSEYYFGKTPEVSIITDLTRNWDVMYNLGVPVVQQFQEQVNQVTVDEDTRDILEDVFKSMREYIQDLSKVADTLGMKIEKYHRKPKEE